MLACQSISGAKTDLWMRATIDTAVGWCYRYWQDPPVKAVSSRTKEFVIHGARVCRLVWEGNHLGERGVLDCGPCLFLCLCIWFMQTALGIATIKKVFSSHASTLAISLSSYAILCFFLTLLLCSFTGGVEPTPSKNCFEDGAWVLLLEGWGCWSAPHQAE